MKKEGRLLLVLVVVMTARLCHGQDLLAAGVCEEFEGVPLPCQSIMVGNWSSVWTAPSLGLSQEYFHSVLLGGVETSATVFVSALDAMTTMDYRCAEVYAQVVCATGFSPCATVGGYDVPVLPCRSVCENANEVCMKYAGKAYFNCSRISAITGGPQYPDDALGSCSVGPGITSLVRFPCPEPMSFVYPEHVDPYTGLPCSVDCWTTRVYMSTTGQDYHDLGVLVSVLSWISFISVIITIVVYLVYPNLREYPTRLVLFSAIGFFFVYLAFVGNSVQSYEDYMCDDDNVYFSNQGWCRFSGWSLYFGAMIVATWWFWQSFVLFYNIGLQQHRERLDKKYEWVMHLWSWLYPLTMSLVFMFVPGENTGAFGIDPWCFSNNDVDLRWTFWVFFYGVFMFYMVCFIVFVSVTLWRVGNIGVRSTMKKKSMANFFLSIGAFGVWYLIAISSVIAFRAYTYEVTGKIQASIADYYTCLLTTPDNSSVCQVWVQNLAVHYFFAVAIGLSGFVLFLLFVVFRERTRQTISQSFSNLADGRTFLDGITSQIETQTSKTSAGTTTSSS